MQKRQCYITLKDHKQDFNIKPRTRLINPTYSKIEQISKLIVKRINNKIIESNFFNQWTNSEQVISWFESLEKCKYKLMKFDIEEFYPSISEQLLNDALYFGK